MHKHGKSPRAAHYAYSLPGEGGGALGLFARKPKRFWDEKAHRANLARQAGDVPQILEQLAKLGVAPDRDLKLEYYFYTNTAQKADGLGGALRQKGYSVDVHPSRAGRRQHVVTGWSTPITMSTDIVSEWSRQMCELGFAHDAEFDGWGTSLEQ